MDKIDIKSDFTNFQKLFLAENSRLNLISKNDEKYLYNKHIYDSLAISLFFKKYIIPSDSTLLDIGCGGGFLDQKNFSVLQFQIPDRLQAGWGENHGHETVPFRFRW